MPFTPFHFGPGLLIKTLTGRMFWLTPFVTANVLIDVEVLYYLWMRSRPFHRYAHSYLGGIVAGLLAGAGTFAVAMFVARVWPGRWSFLPTAKSSKPLLLFQSITAGLVGGISHIFLDSLVHAEIEPFWPFATGNELAGLVSGRIVYLSLVLFGLLGGCIWLQEYLAADR
ncbi:hypothetical protein CA54_44790 [Symmachiella macrocystis]|uniref:Hydrolase n=1 Tax=Symmachiella macrocystis TaxID=2527985 RepID=A0A5C6BD85_9PLAN|nr:hypothetical protein [Symmachiella macrocystis]TWU09239.1 hypothetical protein CA54_44790 [Symmachiella macrocystis]